MPYIITTYTGPLLDPANAGQEPDSRTAVATLDEAVGYTLDRIAEQGYDNEIRRLGDSQAARGLSPQNGGTVGPLPDGTVIEVQEAGWVHLWTEARKRIPSLVSTASHAETLDAFNAGAGADAAPFTVVAAFTLTAADLRENAPADERAEINEFTERTGLDF